MRFFKLFNVTVVAGLLLAGCASVAHVEKDKTVDLKAAYPLSLNF